MKKFIIFMLFAAMMLSICGCKTETVHIEGEALAKSVLDEFVFSDELTPIDSSLATLRYSVEGAQEVIVYVGSGATAEEICLVRSSDTASIKHALELYLEDLEESFASYIPEEVEKIQNAVFMTKGEWVILIISSDPDAEKKLDSLIGV